MYVRLLRVRACVRANGSSDRQTRRKPVISCAAMRGEEDEEEASIFSLNSGYSTSNCS